MDTTEQFDEDIETQFQKAADFVSQNAKKIEVSQNDKLKLYGFYKQATEGPCNIPKPGFFSFEAKAKWEAWNALGKMSKEEAMRRYVSMLSNLVPEWNKQVQRGGTGFRGPVFSRPVQEETDNVDESQEAKTLCYWTRKGNYEEVARLLQSTNVDWKDEEGRTALHWACDGYRNKRNKTRNNTKSSVKVVVNTQKEFLQRGHLKIAELLISKGANINAQDNEGQTPLHYACICEHEELIRLLLLHHADTTIQDKNGESPLTMCSEIITTQLNTLNLCK